MSAKKRKGALMWFECDCCNAVINAKDSVIHKEQSCPPKFQDWVHPFVMNNSLYSNFRTFQLQDKNLEQIPKEVRNSFVLLPCHILQLCKIPIGDPVVVRINGFEKSLQIVKTAWPIQEKAFDFFAALSAEVADLYKLETKAQVLVFKAEEKFLPAKSVTVVCDNINFCDKNLLATLLKTQNLDRILCVGNKLLIKHYGIKVVFNVIDISLFENCDKSRTDCFYCATEKTEWKLSNMEENKTKIGSSINKLGGLSSTLSELKDFISLVLKEETSFSGPYITKGILIHGPPGTGKSTLIQALAEYFTNNIIKIESTKIISKFIGQTERELQCLFDKAVKLRPSVILIDDLDVLCAKSNSASEYEKRIVATLALFMDKLSSNPDASVVVLGTTSNINKIDKMLRCPSRFGKEVDIYVPSISERSEILKILLESVNHNLNDDCIKIIAECSHGFVGADLVSLVSKAIFKNYKTCRGKEKVSYGDFQWALNRVKPSAMKEIAIEIPNIKWDDIGGQQKLKLKLRQCVEWPLKYNDAFTKLGISPPKGVLMFGPPGCSKTMIAKALATESKLNFISVKGPEVFSKWVGESEKAVREIFKKARHAAPSIIFFDELDAIGGERNSSTVSNVQERVLAQLLTELDGVESLDNVTVIGATNRLDRIDPALLRPGRLDRIIYVPLPDDKTREEIFRLQLKKTSIDEDVCITELVKKSENYSGAEIIAVCREAALKALEEDVSAEKLERKHFIDAFSIVTPRTPKSLLNIYDKYLMK